MIDAALFPGYNQLKGKLLLAGDQLSHQQAEEFFRQSIDIARDHGDKMQELDTTVSLSQLLDHQDRRDEAREMLSDIYNEFIEGFETRALREAKRLLDELSMSPRDPITASVIYPAFRVPNHIKQIMCYKAREPEVGH